MANTVLVTASVVDLQVPADTIVGKYQVSITDSAGVVQSQEVDAPEATFVDVVPGDYTASVVLLDSTGGQLGEKKSATFTVDQPATIGVSAADIVTVTVS